MKIKAGDFVPSISCEDIETQVCEVVESIQYHASQNKYNIFVRIDSALDKNLSLDWTVYKHQLY